MTIRTTTSFVINALIIFSTIHAQDFRDEIGDRLMGRRTVPIVWPKGSRIGIFAMLIAWSVGLSWACDLAYHFSVPLCVLAVFIGLRFLRERTANADKCSYRYYNVRVFQRCKLCVRERLKLPPFLTFRQIWLAAAQVVHIPMVAAALSR